METMIFKTPCQTERETLMKKYNIHSAGTIYLIRRRVEKKLEAQKGGINGTK